MTPHAPTHSWRHAAAANRTKLPSCLRLAVLRNDELRAQFRAGVRRFACSWPSRGLTAVSVHVVPQAAEPEAEFGLMPSEISGQADFLLDAWRLRAASGLQCRITSADDPPDAPRIVIAQYWGWHADLGYQRAQRISPEALTRVRQRVCAHYVAMRELMCPAQTLRHRAVGMLL